jgi:protein-L-isoaspartate(D-aspartate) O-methyltransferase
MMSEALHIRPGMRVLEIGTGSGYQTAVLCALGARVFSIEIRPQLAKRAAHVLAEVGAGDVRLELGDGFEGIATHAPYDRVIVTASPPRVPPKLVSQLTSDGEMLVPVGERHAQTLLRVTPSSQGWREVPLLPVLFVPMTGGEDYS